MITAATDGNINFTAGQSVLISGTSVAADNGSFTVQTSSGSGSNAADQFTYVDNNGGIANTTVGGGIAMAVGGTGSLGAGLGSQRSTVDSIVYTFNQAVTLGAGAVTMAVHAGQTGTVPSFSYASPDGGTTWVVTFSGTGAGSSILDGVYDMTLNASAVTANSGGGTLTLSGAGNTQTDTFWRLYGDFVGNETVNNTDRGRFNLAFGLSYNFGNANYQPSLDFVQNGTINNTDRGHFNLNFGKTFTGFTPTI